MRKHEHLIGCLRLNVIFARIAVIAKHFSNFPSVFVAAIYFIYIVDMHACVCCISRIHLESLQNHEALKLYVVYINFKTNNIFSFKRFKG